MRSHNNGWGSPSSSPAFPCSSLFRLGQTTQLSAEHQPFTTNSALMYNRWNCWFATRMQYSKVRAVWRKLKAFDCLLLRSGLDTAEWFLLIGSISTNSIHDVPFQFQLLWPWEDLVTWFPLHISCSDNCGMFFLIEISSACPDLQKSAPEVRQHLPQFLENEVTPWTYWGSSDCSVNSVSDC